MCHAARFLLFLVLGSLLHAQAPDPTWHLVAHAYSFHPKNSETYFYNTTPGLGVMRRHGTWFQGAGIFRNSVGRWAGYGYIGWQRPFWSTPSGPLRFGAIGGITHHYQYNNGNIVPLAAAVLTIPVTRTIAVDLVGIPGVGKALYSTLNISLSWRFR